MNKKPGGRPWHPKNAYAIEKAYFYEPSYKVCGETAREEAVKDSPDQYGPCERGTYRGDWWKNV